MKNMKSLFGNIKHSIIKPFKSAIMKNNILLFGMLLAAGVLHAQARFGIHANGIVSTYSYEVSSAGMNQLSVDPNYGASWKAGVAAIVPIGSKISFMPQLNVLSKGNKDGKLSLVIPVPVPDESGQTFEVPVTLKSEFESRFTYLELPLNFVYNTNGKKGSFFIGIGPSLSYGLGGKEKASATFLLNGVPLDIPELNELSLDADVKFDGAKFDSSHLIKKESHYKALEVGGNVLTGYRFANGFFIQATYNMGFIDIDPNEDAKIKNRYIGLGLGYFFNRR